ncbi:MAG: DUF6146 family protein [Prevotella sp.]|jgi:TonB-dependent SusC/RagA subfamily outer membrane receptor|nr:DUF6146 family protein [Prevotella sp.]
MKKIIILVFITPVFVFGQGISNIEVGKKMKIISAQKVMFPEISNPYEINKEKDRFRWICKPTILTHPPLVIVDGVPGEFENINPSDIESINILKDEEAIAVFGPKGINGVILITTRKLKIEYEAVVLDVGFECFLITQQPKNFYSEAILKNKNIRMVAEWNSRHSQPTRYNPSIYEISIEYNPGTSYGLDVEYTLYMFFKSIEKEYNIRLS